MAIHQIYKYLICEETESDVVMNSTLNNARWFTTNIPETEFTDVNRYICILLQKSSSINMTMTYTNIENFMSLYLKVILATEQIKLLGMESLNLQDPVDLEKGFRVVKEAIIAEIDILKQQENQFANFYECALDFFETQVKKLVINAMTEGMSIVTTGLNKQFGSYAAIDSVESNISRIKYIYDREKLSILTDSKADEFTPRFLLKMGIPAIDNDTLGLYTGQAWGIEGASGTGKTRFSLGVPVYEALRNKLNVCYNALEQSVVEIHAMLIARHVWEVFGIHIEDRYIWRNQIPMELRSKVAAAKYDLLESGNYGKLYVSEEMIYDNDIDVKWSTYDSFKGPFDLFVLDHAYLVEHKSSHRGDHPEKHDIIANTYRKAKRFVKGKDRAVIIINQLNATGQKFAAADKCPPQEGAAGGTEVYRNTDYNMVLARTEVMKAQKKLRIFVPKVRSSAGDISPLLDAQHWNCVYTPSKQQEI